MSAQTELPFQGIPKQSRNQLLIIALLIVLIYASASVVIGFSGHNIEASQRWPLIWFLVLFPLLVLGIFGWLVSRHHSKLYSATATDEPEEMSLSTLTPDQQRRKLNSEIANIAAEAAKQAIAHPSSASVPNFINAGDVQRNEARSVYIVAEDLVLRQLELEGNASFMRHVSLEGVPFDGIAIKQDKITGIEVKFLIAPKIGQEVIDTMLDKAEYTATRLKRTRPVSAFTFMLAIVTQLSSEDEIKLKTHLVNRFALTPVDVDIRFFDFDNLQNEFAADTSAE